MKLSPHFWRSEFECKCGCGFNTADYALVELLEVIRGHFNSRIRVNSGARCAAWNTKVGGSPRSQHLLGKAADIVVDGYTPQQVTEFVTKHMPNHGGIGQYQTFTHVDVRDAKARWGG